MMLAKVFDGAIQKIKVAHFYGPWCIYWS